MGAAKREMERRQDLHAMANAVLLEAGAVEQCEPHETLTDVWDDDAMKRAYAIGTNWFKQGKIDGTRQEFMDAIKSAKEQTADECYTCAKNMRD